VVKFEHQQNEEKKKKRVQRGTRIEQHARREWLGIDGNVGEAKETDGDAKRGEGRKENVQCRTFCQKGGRVLLK